MTTDFFVLTLIAAAYGLAFIVLIVREERKVLERADDRAEKPHHGCVTQHVRGREASQRS